MNDPQTLVKLVSSGNLRVAVGLWLLPVQYLEHEDDEAHRLDLEPIDLRLRRLQTLPAGTKYADLSPESIFNLIDQVSREAGDWAGALVYNLDLLLARLSSEDRKIIWQDLYEALPHRTRGIIMIMPETAINLLPGEEALGRWEREKRLVGSIREPIQ